MTRARRGSEGFTLIELLLAIALAGLVLPALAGAFYLSFRTTAATTDRIASSAATTLLTASFATDIQNSTVLSTASSCALPIGAATLFSAAWSGGSATWATHSITVSGHPRPHLSRVECGAVSSTTTVELDPAVVVPTPPCTPSCSRSLRLTFTPHQGRAVTLHAVRRNS